MGIKIGILELLTAKARSAWEYTNCVTTIKQYASVTPQAISVWCRQMGHQTYYACYYGVGDPKAKLPNDLDLIFISTHSPMSALAYALCKLYQKEDVRTVIGGPHAKSFPHDCLRYFDLVVLECDRSLIADIIHDRFEPGSIISSQKAFDDVPTVEERLPEIKASAFFKGRPYPGSAIPLLASLGCPYTCNFCTDWNTPYRALPADRLAADLRFVAKNFPGTGLGFHDLNFGIRFDETMSVLETVPPARRNPYAVESSLSILRQDRLRRLRDTGCVAMAPGIESWSAYSNKAGVGKAINQAKLDQVVEHCHFLSDYIPYLAANFILGLDNDSGDEPFELTREFILRAPFVWTTINIPAPYGGTPLYDTLLQEDRILRTMPFSFYLLPYLPITLKNYDPIPYMQKMVDLYTLVSSKKMLNQRLKAMPAWVGKGVHLLRTWLARKRLGVFQELLYHLKTDRQFLAFHRGETDRLPGQYVYWYKRKLDQYADLMSIEESRPLLHGGEVRAVNISTPHQEPAAVA